MRPRPSPFGGGSDGLHCNNRHEVVPEQAIDYDGLALGVRLQRRRQPEIASAYCGGAATVLPPPDNTPRRNRQPPRRDCACDSADCRLEKSSPQSSPFDNRRKPNLDLFLAVGYTPAFP